MDFFFFAPLPARTLCTKITEMKLGVGVHHVIKGNSKDFGGW